MWCGSVVRLSASAHGFVREKRNEGGGGIGSSIVVSVSCAVAVFLQCPWSLTSQSSSSLSSNRAP